MFTVHMAETDEIGLVPGTGTGCCVRCTKCEYSVVTLNIRMLQTLEKQTGCQIMIVIVL